jgi:hypothetical protein
MRTGTALAAWGLVAGLALTGCSDGDEPAGGPGPSGPPATISSAPTTDPPHGGPPQLPALAREQSNAGAKAFVRYYIDVLNYAHSEGVAGPLRRLGTRGCDVCQILADGIAVMAQRGGGQQGGDWHLTFSGSLPWTGQRIARVLVRVHVSPGTSRRFAGDKPHRIRPQNHTYQFDLAWNRSAWLLNDIGAA